MNTETVYANLRNELLKVRSNVNDVIISDNRSKNKQIKPCDYTTFLSSENKEYLEMFARLQNVSINTVCFRITSFLFDEFIQFN